VAILPIEKKHVSCPAFKSQPTAGVKSHLNAHACTRVKYHYNFSAVSQ